MDKKQRIVIKIGSSTLTGRGQKINNRVLNQLAKQISQLMTLGHKFVVVTSGAVASGKICLGESSKISKRTYAAIGQRYLIDAWGQAFKKNGLEIGQYLISEENLSNPKTALLDAMRDQVVAIVNANDTISVEAQSSQAISADNDRLAEYIATMIEADMLILLTDIQDGVLDDNHQIIRQLRSSEVANLWNGDKSKVGTGGMASKINVAQSFAKKGGQSVIASGVQKDVLNRILNRDQIGTWVNN